MKLPPAVHEALVADTARAMARRTPAVAHAAAQIRAEENSQLFGFVVPDGLHLDLRLMFTPHDSEFRQEFCCRFTEPSPSCPNCRGGHLVEDHHGRGVRCRSCGYRTWEQGLVYDDSEPSRKPIMLAPAPAGKPASQEATP